MPACCRIWYFVNCVISDAMSTSLIRLSDAVRFSSYVARLLSVCSSRFYTDPNVARTVDTFWIAESMLAIVAVENAVKMAESTE